MRKILICDDDRSIRQVIGLVISSEFDNEIVFATNANEAVEILKKDVNIGLIICDYNMPEESGAFVFNYNAGAANVPFVMLTGDLINSFPDIEKFKTNTINTILHKPWEEEELFDIIKIVFEDEDSDSFIEEATSSDYKKIKTTILYKYLKSEVPCFEKINEFEFTVICNDSVKDHATTYIKKSDYDSLIHCIEEKYKNYKQAISSFKNLFEASSALMDKLVSNADVLDMSLEELSHFSEAVNKQVEQIKAQESMDSMIQNALNSEDYFVGHSVLAMQIAFKVAYKTGFKQENILKKIIQACLLHDSLFENDKLAKISDRIALGNSEISDSEKLLVMNHPIIFAKEFSKHKWIENDVLDAIKSHHFKADEDYIGPKFKVDDISTLSAMINLSLQSADHFYEYGHEDQSIQTLKQQLEKYLGLGNFDFVSDSLMKVLA